MTITSPGSMNGWIAPVVPTRQERADAELGELLDGDRRRRAADAGGAHDDRNVADPRQPRRELAMGGERGRPVHRRRDPLDPGRIAGHDRQRRAVEIFVFQSEMEDAAHRTHGRRPGPGGVTNEHDRGHAAGASSGRLSGPDVWCRPSCRLGRLRKPGGAGGCGRCDGDLQCGRRGETRAVELQHVRKTFGPVVAVADIDLVIDDGEFFSLLGPSGSGKTTVLRMIAGFERPDSGAVLLGGRDVDVARAVRPRRQHGVPGLRAVPAHDRAGERRVRPAGQGRRARRATPAGGGDARHGPPR